MYEYLTIAKEKGLEPVTTALLEQSFRSVGIAEGDTLLVHASVSQKETRY